LLSWCRLAQAESARVATRTLRILRIMVLQSTCVM
jgi:hypothetical protein